MSSEKLDQILATQSRIDIKIDVVNDKVDRCVTGLYGTPERPEVGLNIKVDRLEQSEQKRSKVIWALVAGMVTLIGKSVWAALGW